MEEKYVEVSGQKLSLEQFQEMQKDPNIKLVLVSEGVYKKLDKLEG